MFHKYFDFYFSFPIKDLHKTYPPPKKNKEKLGFIVTEKLIYPPYTMSI